MPWCPKCGTEYVEGVEQCADCGVALVDKEDGKPYSADDEILSNGENEVFLCNLSGPVEISYITSVLDEEGIKYWMADSDPGLYLGALMGSSFLGKDIYVGKGDYKRAAAIVKSFNADAVIEDGAEDGGGE